MSHRVSQRIRDAVQTLPITPGMRILEIGCGPGVAAREVLRQHSSVTVFAIDRSQTAIRQAELGSQREIASGRLILLCTSIEDFTLPPHERSFDLAFALRVGALDGRHPDVGRYAFARIKQVLIPGGRLFIDGGSPLTEIIL